MGLAPTPFIRLNTQMDRKRDICYHKMGSVCKGEFVREYTLRVCRGFHMGEQLKKRGTPSMCPSFTVMISDLITRVIDIFYLAPVVACVGTGAAGGAQATLIMERIMW